MAGKKVAVFGIYSTRAAVENADIVEPEKSALEDIAALDVLAVDPPGEVDSQL